ncbi:PepSY-associated TM helix domain-containing protein [Candidatus Poribacteria bacterium]|nr:PepSY-associated TM helix domain-containing protein [Candidatus Poribacteria bacterium]
MLSRNLPRWIEIWNRKLHIYISLYLLLFVWLFSVSGLLLNHPKWKFPQFWPQRKQSSFEQPIQLPMETGDLAKARNLMRQLNISGEISWTTTYPKEDHFDFRVTTPGKIIDIKTDLKAKRATVEQIQVNVWGVLHLLHTFTGVRMNEPKEKRDWFATKLWSLSVDAVCIGLLFQVLSSLIMWYQIMEKRRLGLFLLIIGVLCCGFFAFGLGWMK